MAKKKGKKKGKMLSIPGLGNVETFSLVPEGDYTVKVVDIEQKEGDKADYLSWTLEITEGEFKGQKLWNNTSFSEKSLWNLKAWLEALEADIPEEPEDVAANDYLGLECVVSVEHEKREGKNRARITDYAPVDGDEKEDVTVEDEEDEEGETYTEEQVRDMDDDELKDLIKKHGLGIKLKEYKTAKKARSAVIDALEEEDLIGEEEDE